MYNNKWRKKVRVNGSEDIIYNSNQYLILPPHSSIEMEINKPTKALVLKISDNYEGKI